MYDNVNADDGDYYYDYYYYYYCYYYSSYSPLPVLKQDFKLTSLQTKADRGKD